METVAATCLDATLENVTRFCFGSTDWRPKLHQESTFSFKKVDELINNVVLSSFACGMWIGTVENKPHAKGPFTPIQGFSETAVEKTLRLDEAALKK